MSPGLRLRGRDAAAVQEFVSRVRASLGDNVVELRLFGSKATGRATPESEIDILLLVNGATVALEDEVLAVAFDVKPRAWRLHLPRSLSGESANVPRSRSLRGSGRRPNYFVSHLTLTRCSTAANSRSLVRTVPFTRWAVAIQNASA